MSKKKGTRAERELLHMFYQAKWGVLRVAGSGSTTLPSPDLLAGNGTISLAIECKSIKSSSKYFPKEEIGQLKLFSKMFGAMALIAIRFDNEGWYFIEPHKLKKTKSEYFVLNHDLACKKGLKFDGLVDKFKRVKVP